MTVDDYQRDYELMQAWAHKPLHRHHWLFDVVRRAWICECGAVETDDARRANYRRTGA